MSHAHFTSLFTSDHTYFTSPPVVPPPPPQAVKQPREEEEHLRREGGGEHAPRNRARLARELEEPEVDRVPQVRLGWKPVHRLHGGTEVRVAARQVAEDLRYGTVDRWKVKM